MHKSNPVYLHQFRKLKAPVRLSQSEAKERLAWMHATFSPHGASTVALELWRKRLSRLGFDSPGVENRGSFLDLFESKNTQEALRFFREALIDERTDKYIDIVKKCFEDLYSTKTPPNLSSQPSALVTQPESLIHVTCTGYSSPSAAQLWTNEKQLSTSVYHAYQMGCYAAIPALEMAEGLLFTKTPTVDIAHTEICTLHFKFAEDLPADEIVVQSLFADGAVAYQLTQTPPDVAHFKILQTGFKTIPRSTAEMVWNLGPWAFQMRLGRNVPKILAQGIFEHCPFIKAFSKSEVPFAIHPGGPKIIDELAQSLELNPNQVRHSREVLRDHGNMSSATLPSVWDQILSDPAIPNGSPVVSLAFGPGLTLAWGLFEKRTV